jgi:hypothetical protein
MAKVKMAAKERHALHGRIQNRLTDYSNNSRPLASALSGDSGARMPQGGCADRTLAAPWAGRLIHLSRIARPDARLWPDTPSPICVLCLTRNKLFRTDLLGWINVDAWRPAIWDGKRLLPWSST